MRPWARLLYQNALLLFWVCLAAVFCASAQNLSYNFGANLGTLNYTETDTDRSCAGIDYVHAVFSNFVYVSSTNKSQPISGGTYYNGLPARYDGTNGCPHILGPEVTYNNTSDGAGYTITINPGAFRNGVNFATIDVPGYINPKYVVLGVYYAVPGSSSSVDYTKSTMASSTVSTKDSYTTGYSQTITSTTSAMFGWKFGKIDTSVSQSTSFSQSTTTTGSGLL